VGEFKETEKGASLTNKRDGIGKKELDNFQGGNCESKGWTDLNGRVTIS